MTERSPCKCFAVTLMFSLICSCSQAASDNHYIIRCLDNASTEEEYAGLGKVKVIAVDTRSGAENRVDEPFHDKITMVWCYEWDTLAAGVYTTDFVPIDLTALPQVRDFVRAAVGYANVKTVANSVCCSPVTGLKGLRCEGWLPSTNGGLSEKFARFYCICDKDGGGLVYVDGELLMNGVNQNGSRPPEHMPAFDHDGKYFYYIVHGLVKRFNVTTHEIDTIPGGDVPMIPWNQEVVIVYSRDDHMLKLLGEKNEVKGTIDWCLDGDIHTVYAVDSTTFLVGVKWLYVVPGSFGVDSQDLMAIYELDFHQGRVQRLVKGVHLAGQILSVERVE